jgi:hypothetical protein
MGYLKSWRLCHGPKVDCIFCFLGRVIINPFSYEFIHPLFWDSHEMMGWMTINHIPWNVMTLCIYRYPFWHHSYSWYINLFISVAYVYVYTHESWMVDIYIYTWLLLLCYSYYYDYWMDCNTYVYIYIHTTIIYIYIYIYIKIISLNALHEMV